MVPTDIWIINRIAPLRIIGNKRHSARLSPLICRIPVTDSSPARRLFASCLAVSLISGLAACGSDGGDGAKGDRAATVGYIVAQPSTVPVPVTLGGRVVAFQTSEVRPQVNGLIKRVYFSEGGYVKAGQPLFQIDPSLYRAAVEQARANLASAQASAAAASAKADRYKPLVEMGAVSQQDYTDALAAANQARAAIAQSRAALDTAQINLRFTTVPAPIGGRIGRSLFTVGALVSNNQTDPLAVIQQTDPVYVDMQQSAAELTRLRQSLAEGGATAGSTTVHLTLDNGSKYALPGTVQFSEISVSEDTGTVTLRARFPNPAGLLLPGMFVNASFDQATETGAFRIPQQAVKRDFDGSAYLYVVGKDGKAERRSVKTERTAGADWVVTSGLKAGEKVITQAQDTLKAGAAIKPVPATTPDRAGKQPATGKAGSAGQGG
ncbi:efflux RND transporter periplasmic adaptor subunit [Tsuneonella suprasediminis]|uniref:Efflux RND transporter periplasmic adaptor subunit n=1 Tax=Tsuneonella suprasediminis TaxID=2306996 RepID=A0A419R1U7_9SPHN|nr:efflux RND transporter periplasmic adaptor subunit [Tsuneonella suprasediminis]